MSENFLGRRLEDALAGRSKGKGLVGSARAVSAELRAIMQRPVATMRAVTIIAALRIKRLVCSTMTIFPSQQASISPPQSKVQSSVHIDAVVNILRRG